MYKCPFHYIGGKAKLLDQIIPLIDGYQPTSVVDLFAGGFSVGVNVTCETVFCNDKNDRFVSLLEWLSVTDLETILQQIENEISLRKLSKTNAEAYYRLKNDYNNNPTPLLLFLLICYAFNHQMRFNQSNLFNTPFGKNRSSYNKSTRAALVNFVKKLKAKNITFSSQDFQKIQPVGARPLVFVDPPYFLSTGSYNDGNRGIVSWTENDEIRLYKYLDSLSQKGIAFVLTNFIESDDKINDHLAEFAKKYTVLEANSDYSNSNYHKNKKKQKEIIVRNFQ